MSPKPRQMVQACPCSDPAYPHSPLLHWWRDEERAAPPRSERERIIRDLNTVRQAPFLQNEDREAVERAIEYLKGVKE